MRVRRQTIQFTYNSKSGDEMTTLAAETLDGKIREDDEIFVHTSAKLRQREIVVGSLIAARLSERPEPPQNAGPSCLPLPAQCRRPATFARFGLGHRDCAPSTA